MSNVAEIQENIMSEIEQDQSPSAVLLRRVFDELKKGSTVEITCSHVAPSAASAHDPIESPRAAGDSAPAEIDEDNEYCVPSLKSMCYVSLVNMAMKPPASVSLPSGSLHDVHVCTSLPDIAVVFTSAVVEDDGPSSRDTVRDTSEFGHITVPVRTTGQAVSLRPDSSRRLEGTEQATAAKPKRSIWKKTKRFFRKLCRKNNTDTDLNFYVITTSYILYSFLINHNII